MSTLIKWFTNQSKGIFGEYIKVDMVTGNAELVDSENTDEVFRLRVF